ncbi:hypothetical protein F5051DRAFT_413208 [Lentinula edodes]|nr:hypothetical protein F5051DRAFT_413208 [Lentinula edodes]
MYSTTFALLAFSIVLAPPAYCQECFENCAPSTTNASTFIIIFVVIAVVVFALSSIVALVRYRRIKQFQHDLVQHATFEASTIPTPYAIPESMHHAHHHHAHHHAHMDMNMQNMQTMGMTGGGGATMAGY